jgi:hypothetical protein
MAVAVIFVMVKSLVFMRMYLRTVVIFFGLLSMMSLKANPLTANDSLMLMKLINQPLQMVCKDNDNGFWVVAGSNGQRLYHVNNRQQLQRLDHVNRKLDGVEISTMFSLNKDMVLLGTLGSYLFCVRNNRLTQFDYRHGLTDSVITRIEVDVRTRQVIIHGDNKQFLLNYMASRNQLNFKQVDGREQGASDEGIIKRYFRKPLQKAICDIFGDVDFSFKRQKSITGGLIGKIHQQLKPGDILIKRNDYQLSNVAIPGFWTHAALYVGSLKEMDALFAGLPALNGRKASEYVKLNHYEVYKRLQHRHQLIVESVGDGVSVNSLGHIARVDYFAAIRPRVDLQTTFDALLEAFSFYGLPYDYLFDMKSDDAMICSELVFKAYGSNDKDLHFKMSRRDGQLFLSPSDIAKQCIAEAANESPSLRLVVFCGIPEEGKKAAVLPFDEFKKATKRGE